MSALAKQDSGIELPKVYKPLLKPSRYKVLFGGRYAARSWTLARLLLIYGASQPLRILCTRELQKSIKQSVHRLLSDQIRLLGLDKFYEIQAQGIYGRNGTEFMFLGIRSNPDEIRSLEGINYVWIEEAHNLTETSWNIIDPTIRREDSEIWLSFNTRFKFDYAYQKFVDNRPPPNSIVMKTSYHDIPEYVTEVIKEQIQHMQETDYEGYLHVWEGELKQLAEGAIFGKQVIAAKQANRLCHVPIQKNCEVMTFFDLGKSDETAVWFMQRVGPEYRFIDYFQGRLEDVEHYVRFIRAQPYLYAMHFMPHDADHDRLGMKRNIREQFEDGGVRPVTVVPRVSHKMTAIELAREKFSECWFHKGDDGNKPANQCEGYYACEDPRMQTRAKRAEVGWEALCNYRFVYKDDDNVYVQTPHHDHASNGADAFQQFAQANLNVFDGNRGMDWSVPING